MKTIEQLQADTIRYCLHFSVAGSLSALLAGVKYANGCGAKNSIKVPKTMWGVDIESTCYIHDIEWQLAKSYKDLIAANKNFNKNLLLIIAYESNPFMWLLRRSRVFWYVTMVKLFGTKAYARERGFEIP